MCVELLYYVCGIEIEKEKAHLNEEKYIVKKFCTSPNNNFPKVPTINL